ncbi:MULTISPECIES: hypothetical protein [unclassified Streptomyces]|uniref:hypothetical protein n=1 Tax=unclassified Streptomyces TaxID=2593676 RepID=UPI00093DD1AA|nr:hypothetical protein [Streptomyces sp. CB02058]OKI87512.1 hypothetical protein AMK10_34540 [Streptomyces sp. CB02058]
MGAIDSYGTQREAVEALLYAAAPSAMVLSYREDRAFAALSLNRFGSVGSTRLDWSGAEVLERTCGFDAAELCRLVGEYGGGGLGIVFPGNLCVPSVAVDLALVGEYAAPLLDCPECWVFLVDQGVLIEFQDGEGFVVARVPAPE